MSDDLYALSPITSASRAGAMAIPSETDYEAIRTAFMETARGRWFLAEYARRNRNADTNALLAAIERIEAAIRGEPVAQSDGRLRLALAELAQAIARTKAEIVAIKPEGDDQDDDQDKAAEAALAFADLTDGDDEAKSDLMAAAEGIQDIVWTLRERDGDATLCHQLEATAREVLAAASRDELTLKRSQKAAQLLRYLESRINGLMEANGGTASEPAAADGNGHDTPTAEAGAGDGHSAIAPAPPAGEVATEADPAAQHAVPEPAPSDGDLAAEPPPRDAEQSAAEAPSAPVPHVDAADQTSGPAAASDDMMPTRDVPFAMTTAIPAPIDFVCAPVPLPGEIVPPAAPEKAPSALTVLPFDFANDTAPPAAMRDVTESEPASNEEATDETPHATVFEESEAEPSPPLAGEEVAADVTAPSVDAELEAEAARADPLSVHEQPETEPAPPEETADEASQSRADIAVTKGFAAILEVSESEPASIEDVTDQTPHATVFEESEAEPPPPLAREEVAADVTAPSVDAEAEAEAARAAPLSLHAQPADPEPPPPEETADEITPSRADIALTQGFAALRAAVVAAESKPPLDSTDDTVIASEPPLERAQEESVPSEPPVEAVAEAPAPPEPASIEEATDEPPHADVFEESEAGSPPPLAREEVAADVTAPSVDVEPEAEMVRADPPLVCEQPETDLAPPEETANETTPSRADIALTQGFAALRAAVVAAASKPPLDSTDDTVAASEPPLERAQEEPVPSESPSALAQEETAPSEPPVEAVAEVPAPPEPVATESAPATALAEQDAPELVEPVDDPAADLFGEEPLPPAAAPSEVQSAPDASAAIAVATSVLVAAASAYPPQPRLAQARPGAARPAASDPLAPVMVLSDEEKIALFS